MGDLRVSDVPEHDVAQLRSEAEALGLSFESYVRMKRAAGADRGKTARAIRALQSSVAQRDSVDLIREDRKAR